MISLHIVILALVQGITEFLPVSSSGHLVLTHHLLDGGGANLCWEENRTLDVAVHVGTLASVLLYFRRDVCTMACGLLRAEFRLLSLVILASLPVIAAGFGLHLLQPSFLCLLQVMAWTTLVFGIVLWVADRFSPAQKTIDDMNRRDALLIGLSQALALVPGTSRSGITMTAARALGYTRTEAAHFSLLLSIVAIAGAGTLGSLDLVQSGNADLSFDALIAAVLAFVSGWIAIALMMKWLEKATFTPFAIYRVVLGVLLLGLIYGGVLG